MNTLYPMSGSKMKKVLRKEVHCSVFLFSFGYLCSIEIENKEAGTHPGL